MKPSTRHQQMLKIRMVSVGECLRPCRSLQRAPICHRISDSRHHARQQHGRYMQPKLSWPSFPFRVAPPRGCNFLRLYVAFFGWHNVSMRCFLRKKREKRSLLICQVWSLARINGWRCSRGSSAVCLCPRFHFTRLFRLTRRLETLQPK